MRRTHLVLPFLVLVALAFLPQTYRLCPAVAVPPLLQDSLSRLAEKALANKEVPIGAVLLYRDSIIGSGFNTVVHDSILSGHAEINAINDAYQRCGMNWKNLDRSELALFSTYEPCEMCKGALLHYGIRHVVFEGPKPALGQAKTILRNWQYECQKRRMNAPDLQENLFRRHPSYHHPN